MDLRVELRIPVKRDEASENVDFINSITSFVKKKFGYLPTKDSKEAFEIRRLAISRYAFRLGMLSHETGISDLIGCIRNYDMYLGCFIDKIAKDDVKKFIHNFQWTDTICRCVHSSTDIRVEMQSVLYNKIAALSQLVYNFIYNSEWISTFDTIVSYLIEITSCIKRLKILNDEIKNTPIPALFKNDKKLDQSSTSNDFFETRLDKTEYLCSAFLQMIVIHKQFNYIDSTDLLEDEQLDELHDFSMGLAYETSMVKSAIEYLTSKIVEGQSLAFICFVYFFVFSIRALKQYREAPDKRDIWWNTCNDARVCCETYNRIQNNVQANIVPSEFSKSNLLTMMTGWVVTNTPAFKYGTPVNDLISKNIFSKDEEFFVISTGNEFNQKIQMLKKTVWPSRDFMDWLIRNEFGNVKIKDGALINPFSNPSCSSSSSSNSTELLDLTPLNSLLSVNQRKTVTQALSECHDIIISILKKNMFLLSEYKNLDESVNEDWCLIEIENITSVVNKIKLLLSQMIMGKHSVESFIFKQCCNETIVIITRWLKITSDIIKILKEDKTNSNDIDYNSLQSPCEIRLGTISDPWKTCVAAYIKEKMKSPYESQNTEISCVGSIDSCKDLIVQVSESFCRFTNENEKKIKILTSIKILHSCIKSRCDDIVYLLNAINNQDK